VLRVSDVVVCGHSQCGAMSAMLNGLPDEPPMPHLREWLKLGEPIRQLLATNYPEVTDADEQLTLAAEENVLFALDNLHTYPCVQRRLADGTLRVHGWFFRIANAELFAFDPETRQFHPISNVPS
jgi:carbonic anhydrase